MTVSTVYKTIYAFLTRILGLCFQKEYKSETRFFKFMSMHVILMVCLCMLVLSSHMLLVNLVRLLHTARNMLGAMYGNCHE